MMVDEASTTGGMEGVARLAAGAAHEINNPVGVLMMKLKFLLSIAADEGLSERAIASLQVAVEQTERIERIVERLVAFSRPPAGTAQRLDVNAQIEAALAARPSPPAGLEVRWQPGAAVPDVDADPAQLARIVGHLVDNAVEAMAVADASGQVTVRTVADAEAVLLTVRDDGPGIPADFVERIFDPFFSTKPTGDGTGLGLAVVDALVRGLGGTIHVDSVRQAGTTVTVRLPGASR